jgi:hypothetical protein
MKIYSALFVVVLVVVVACANSESSSPNYDGTWKADISGGVLTFAVQGEEILGWEWSGPTEIGSMLEIGRPIPIENSAFTNQSEGSSSTTTWLGSFTSSDSASGTISMVSVCEDEAWTARKVDETPIVNIYVGLSQGSNPVLEKAGEVTFLPSSSDFFCTEGLCRASFPVGTEVTIVPEPEPGHTFKGWSFAEQCANANPCTLTLERYTSLGALFE